MRVFVEHEEQSREKGAEKEQKGAISQQVARAATSQREISLKTERQGERHHTRSTASLRTASRLPSSFSAMEDGGHGSPSLVCLPACLSPSPSLSLSLSPLLVLFPFQIYMQQTGKLAGECGFSPLGWVKLRARAGMG
jgi:hypothetical protein